MKKKRPKKRGPGKLYTGFRLPDLSEDFLRLINEELVITMRIPIKRKTKRQLK